MPLSNTEWKKRYIDTLLALGVSEGMANRLYIEGSGQGDTGYSPEWYARQEYECKINT